MKATDLREKSAEDLAELQKSLAHDVFQNRLKNFTNRLDDTSSIRKTKRDLARVLTLLRERDGGVKAGSAHAAPAAVSPPEAPAAVKEAPVQEKPKAKSPGKKASASAKKGEAK
jgi:large subunit ribosomal protein L29